MARPTSPPPQERPLSPGPTPRQRLRSLFGSSSGGNTSTGSIISRAKSPSKGFRRGRSNSPEFELLNAPPSSPPVVSQLQLRPVEGGGGEEQHISPPPARCTSPVQHIARPTSPPAPPISRPTSPFKLHRTLSRRLSSSSSVSGGPSVARRPSRSPMSPAGIGSCDLPPASSDVGEASRDAAAATMTTARPTSPFKAFSPPGSPQKHSRPFPPPPPSSSRPSSPTKEFSPLSGSQSPRKRAVDKAMIGLPTNFKHTSSGGGGGIGSTSSSSDAVLLAGLASPSSSGQEARRRSAALASSRPSSPVAHNISRPVSPSMSAPDYDAAANESLALSLAHINSALNGSDDSGYARSSGEPDQSQSQSSRLDTVKEVPSGFIQRFEKAGQTPSPNVGSRGTRADARWLFGTREEGSGEMEAMQDGLPASDGGLASLRGSGSPSLRGDTSSSPPLRASASTSPTRMGRRKPVPRVCEDESATSSDAVVLSPSVTHTAAMPSPPTGTTTTTTWDATLAEISAALQLDADTNPALVGKKQFEREELDVKW